MQRRSPVLGAIDARQDPALPFREREKREKGCLGVDRDEHFRWRTCPLRRCLPRLQLLDDGARNFVGDVGITSGDVLLFLFPVENISGRYRGCGTRSGRSFRSPLRRRHNDATTARSNRSTPPSVVILPCRTNDFGSASYETEFTDLQGPERGEGEDQ